MNPWRPMTKAPPLGKKTGYSKDVLGAFRDEDGEVYYCTAYYGYGFWRGAESGKIIDELGFSLFAWMPIPRGAEKVK